MRRYDGLEDWYCALGQEAVLPSVVYPNRDGALACTGVKDPEDESLHWASGLSS